MRIRNNSLFVIEILLSDFLRVYRIVSRGGKYLHFAIIFWRDDMEPSSFSLHPGELYCADSAGFSGNCFCGSWADTMTVADVAITVAIKFNIRDRVRMCAS